MKIFDIFILIIITIKKCLQAAEKLLQVNDASNKSGQYAYHTFKFETL